jgi:DNA-binding MarR family transcriptional regulator
MQRYFKTTPPAVHGMVMQLENKGFIEKKPNEARSIKLLLSRAELPDLE